MLALRNENLCDKQRSTKTLPDTPNCTKIMPNIGFLGHTGRLTRNAENSLANPYIEAIPEMR